MGRGVERRWGFLPLLAATMACASSLWVFASGPASGTVTGALSFSVSVDADFAREGDANGADPGIVPEVFTVTLSQPQAVPVNVIYDTVVPSMDRACPAIWPTPCAEPGEDYSQVSGAVTFAPSDTVETFSVPILADNRAEGYESFPLQVSAPAIGWSDYVHGSIDDDDPAVMASYGVAVKEGHIGTADAVVGVRLSTYGTVPITVDFRTVKDSVYMEHLRATAGQDYQSTSGRLTFEPGETHKTLVVRINGDRTPEPDERFEVRLSNVKNAAMWQDITGVWITNDD